MNRTQETESFMGNDLMALCIALANTHMFYTYNVVLYKNEKAVPLQAWSGPEGSRKLTLWRRNFLLNFSTL